MSLDNARFSPPNKNLRPNVFFFSSSMRILPLPLLPLLLSFLFAEIRRHRHQLSRHALRVRDIDNFTIIQQYNFITIQFSKIRISSPPDFTRLSNTFHSFLFIHRADWHDFEFYLPFERSVTLAIRASHWCMWKNVKQIYVSGIWIEIRR